MTHPFQSSENKTLTVLDGFRDDVYRNMAREDAAETASKLAHECGSKLVSSGTGRCRFSEEVACPHRTYNRTNCPVPQYFSCLHFARN